MSKVWVVVAESSRAKIYQTDRHFSEFSEVDDLVHPESRLHESEITSDLPGSRASSGSGSHHSVDDQTSAKQEEAIRFAQQIDARLEQARTQGDYDQLVVCAEPSFLGLLRKNVNANVAKLIAHELDKSLLHEDTQALRAHLPKVLA